MAITPGAGTKYYFQAVGDDGKTRYFAVTAANEQAARTYLYDNYAIGGLTYTGESPMSGITYEDVVPEVVPEAELEDEFVFPTEPRETEAEAGFGAEFMRHLATLGPEYRAVTPRRTARIAEAQYAPLRGLFEAQQVGRTVPYGGEEQQRAWNAFLEAQAGPSGFPAVAGGRVGPGVEAWRNLEYLAGRGPEGQLTGEQKQWFWPTEMEEAMPVARAGRELLGSMTSPLMQQYSNIPTTPELARGYVAQRGAGDISGDIVQFIRRNLGLGGVGAVGQYPGR